MAEKSSILQRIEDIRGSYPPVDVLLDIIADVARSADPKAKEAKPKSDKPDSAKAGK